MKVEIMSDVVIQERAKNIVGADYGSVVENLTWLRDRQTEISFKMGQENEQAKIRAIYKDANDLKELEDRIKEYLEEVRNGSPKINQVSY